MPRTSAAGLLTLDRYLIEARIGRGGMAEVYRGKLARVGGFVRDVAVKVLLPQLAGEKEFINMLMDEARIAATISHPNVVQMLDVGQEGETFYLVMEYVDGTDLRSVERRHPDGAVPLDPLLFIIAEVLRGLAAIHEARDAAGAPLHVIHRDVTPSNVLLTRGGTVKLADFGIAHATGRLTHTQHGAVKGKTRYMSPEQLNGATIDHRSDLFAVGVVFLEALLGRAGASAWQTTGMGAIFRVPAHIPPGLPAEVERVLRRALAERLEDRYQSAAAFRRDVLRALHVRCTERADETDFAADELTLFLREVMARPDPRSAALEEARPASSEGAPKPGDLGDRGDREESGDFSDPGRSTMLGPSAAVTVMMPRPLPLPTLTPVLTPLLTSEGTTGVARRVEPRSTVRGMGRAARATIIQMTRRSPTGRTLLLAVAGLCLLVLGFLLVQWLRPRSAEGAETVKVETAETAEAPLATPVVRRFPSAGAALAELLAQRPRVLAFGEYHETLQGPKVPSSLRRFTEQLLPALLPLASDLVVETWISQGDCGKKEEVVVKDVARTTARPQKTEDEIVTMVRRAKEGGVVPHALTMSCDDYKAIYTDQGVDYDKMLTIMTRQLRGRVEAALQRGDGSGPRRLILVYGGALHNDVYPKPELQNYTFGPPLRQRLGSEYLEIDVFVPEYIQRNAAMRKEPWYALAQKAARPGQTLLIERGPGSYILLFPRGGK